MKKQSEQIPVRSEKIPVKSKTLWFISWALQQQQRSQDSQQRPVHRPGQREQPVRRPLGPGPDGRAHGSIQFRFILGHGARVRPTQYTTQAPVPASRQARAQPPSRTPHTQPLFASVGPGHSPARPSVASPAHPHRLQQDAKLLQTGGPGGIRACS